MYPLLQNLIRLYFFHSVGDPCGLQYSNFVSNFLAEATSNFQLLFLFQMNHPCFSARVEIADYEEGRPFFSKEWISHIDRASTSPTSNV